MGCGGKPGITPEEVPQGSEWRMKAVMKRPCDLCAGELRRVSADPAYPLVAYYWCCPVCGYANVAVHGKAAGHGTQGISEEGGNVSFSEPVRCMLCDAELDVAGSVARLRAGCRVRGVRWRGGRDGGDPETGP